MGRAIGPISLPLDMSGGKEMGMPSVRKHRLLSEAGDIAPLHNNFTSVTYVKKDTSES